MLLVIHKQVDSCSLLFSHCFDLLALNLLHFSSLSALSHEQRQWKKTRAHIHMRFYRNTYVLEAQLFPFSAARVYFLFLSVFLPQAGEVIPPCTLSSETLVYFQPPLSYALILLLTDRPFKSLANAPLHQHIFFYMYRSVINLFCQHSRPFIISQKVTLWKNELCKCVNKNTHHHHHQYNKLI